MEIVIEETQQQGFRNDLILREAAKNIHVINRNGFDLMCPFQPPMKVPVQSLDIANPKSQIVHASCMSTCAHFTIEENEEGKIVRLGCGNSTYKFTENQIKEAM